MPTFEAWLVETYGSDLSKITEIKKVPSNVTGTWVGRRGFLAGFLVVARDGRGHQSELMVFRPLFLNV